MKRRDFFKIMGIASGAALSACNTNDADKTILPYLVPPEDDIIPGVPRYALSTCTECPAMCGIKIKIRDDKAVKLEGNPHHPVNQGALCMRGQASLARLYHPGRIRQPLLRNADGTFKVISWEDAFTALKKALASNTENGLRSVYLSSTTTGSLDLLIDEFCKGQNIERLKEVEVFNHGAVKDANKKLFAQPVVPHYRIDKADVLVTLGADIFETYISPVQWMKQFRLAKKNNHIKWYHAEPYLTMTGASAQGRSLIKPGSEAHLLAYLLHNVPHRNPLPETLLADVPTDSIDKVAEITGLPKTMIAGITDALKLSNQPLIISGGPAVADKNGKTAALYTAMLQWALGMVDVTVDFDHSHISESADSFSDLASFVEDCNNGQIGLAIYSRVFAASTLPGLLDSMKKVAFKVAFTQMPDDITDECDLILPLANPLESWGDASPRKGLTSVIQPVMKPLQDSKSEGDILLGLLGQEKTYRDYLSEQWQDNGQELIDKGFKEVEVPKLAPKILAGTAVGNPGNVYAEGTLYVVPSVRTYDGRSADIALLEEIPDPMSSITYGKFITLSVQEAKQLNVVPGDNLDIQFPSGKVKLAAAINPGMPKGVRTVSIDALQHVALKGIALPMDKAGHQLQTLFQGIKLTPTGTRAKIAALAGATATGNRNILPVEEHQGDAHHEDHHKPHKHEKHTLYEPHDHKDYRWGMVIDLDACTGCSACVAACYVENNVPVVGKEEHLKGREMSWLRIEAYYNNPEKPEFLPMMCQQCDSAPCETVCPVYATYHNPEGLNAQVYNRCVGTRYCANNCPYKVRRFNWFDNSSKLPLYQQSNPDLSVRPSGVMEKCSFCIQRIRYAKDQAKDDKRLVKDGEVVPACAQTCPAGAITFGNLMDPNSQVSKKAKEADAYRVQEELGTEPAVYYIKRKMHEGDK
jgi:Fe-S-cluster-containing dehydrogenase component/NADH dehydrogenase/NADH:ubiquinone oxidoreductase subunit G